MGHSLFFLKNITKSYVTAKQESFFKIAYNVDLKRNDTGMKKISWSSYRILKSSWNSQCYFIWCLKTVLSKFLTNEEKKCFSNHSGNTLQMTYWQGWQTHFLCCFVLFVFSVNKNRKGLYLSHMFYIKVK